MMDTARSRGWVSQCTALWRHVDGFACVGATAHRGWDPLPGVRPWPLPLQAPRMTAVFGDARAALQLLVQRIAEERLRPALEA